MLGGGHTSMSRNRWRFDHNGLRSGSYGYVHNLYGFYLDGGYSSLFSSVPNTDFRPGGWGFGGGFCYEHQRGLFRMQLGLGLRYQTVKNTIGDTVITDPTVTDAFGYHYKLHYYFHDRQDCSKSLHAQLPILFGMGVQGFYFLTGVKLNYTFRGSTHVSALGTTTGTYPQFEGIFQEMDNHGFRKDVDIQRDGPKLDFKFDALLSLEVGYEYCKEPPRGTRYSLQLLKPGERMEYRVRIAAFVDYGLANICPKTDNHFVYIPKDYKWDFAKYEMNHVFSTTLAQPFNVHNFYAGIKFTFLFGKYKYTKCVLCSGFESEATMNTIGSRGRRYWKR